MPVHTTALLEAFLNSNSKAVRLYNFPSDPRVFLTSFFLPDSPTSMRPIPQPQSMWTINDHASLGIWAVFKTHEEACAILSLPPTNMNLAPALESDLEPFHKLSRFHLDSPSAGPLPPQRCPPMLHIQDSPLSSNPPNPRSNFRVGDWICSSPNCAAHNFGRNIACIGCGATRATLSPTSNRPPLSPRFASSPNAPTVYPPSTPSPARPSVSLPSSISQSKNGHPLLTPSGRAFAVGGRVQNISYDPLLPCVMYWPDNEPFPESGQIRPNGLVAIPHPPILNTGNRGPIAHQPGDWICKTCNYLNWRRRKVCQTCFPYAEGNGDSISAAVQAERIALLTSVLTQHQGPGLHPSLAPLRTHVLRAHSVTPPQVRRPFVDVSPPQSRGPYRSQSQVELGSQYMHQERLLPIYQTSGHRRPSPPKQSLSQQQQQLHHRLQIQQLQQQLQQLELHAPTPAPLLPSFLQDIVRSPTLSPSSTSSADLSFDEYEYEDGSPQASIPPRSRHTSSDSINLANIWKMDGNESKTMSAFALPNTIISGNGSRKSSLEKLRN